jgi:hypothetical protein
LGPIQAGRELGLASAVAGFRQTLLCTYLSAVLFVGLGVNSMLGWAWADPIAAWVIAGIAVKEGLNDWRGDSCCAQCLAALRARALLRLGRHLLSDPSSTV